MPHHPAPPTNSASSSIWQIHQLKLHPRLVLSIAVSSLKVRIMRSLLTLFTIAASSAFLIFLLTIPRGDSLVDRQSWMLMLALSLLVSAAGVLNTMLMAVTQRYREIGTIKCLGGLDSFVLYSVITEAMILGLAGAFTGLFIGLVLAVGVSAIDHGLQFLSNLRLEGFMWKSAISILTGILLTTLGAMPPAFIAARMPPIEAMRGEK